MILGITGSIGSGKSTAARIFAKRGFKLIDADTIAHEVIENPKIKKILMKIFGKGIVEKNKIDRKKLGTIVFSSKSRLEKLNSIMHPAIVNEVKNKIKKIKSGKKHANIIIDAPLLLEAGMGNLVDKVIVVVASEKEIEKRSSNFSSEDVRKISAFQMPMEEKVKQANYVIDNTFGHEKLKRQVDSIISKLRLKST